MTKRRSATRLVMLLLSGPLCVFLVEWVFCRWPAPHHLSPAAAALAAIAYISLAVLSGSAATLLFWASARRSATVSLGLFIAVSAIGWVWIPSVVLLSRQHSLGALAVAISAGAVVAAATRKILSSHDATPNVLNAGLKPAELFAQYLETTPREGEGFIVAISLYSAFFLLHKQRLCSASFLLALCAFLVTWRLKTDSVYGRGDRKGGSQPTMRLARVTSMAVLVTTMLLLLGIQHASSVATDYFALDRRASARSVSRQQRTEMPYADVLGYRRIILWPIPEKKKVVLPVLSRTALSGFNIHKPLTIHFEGSYWYFQPRAEGEKSRAHVARGSPLTVEIRSTNHIPLIMEAHQVFAAAIPLACCREIQIEIENGDNARGIVALGVLLTDSTSLGKPTLYLDPQTIVSTEPGSFTVKPAPVPEVLRFHLPASAQIRQFDEITLIFLPDSERPYTAPKIAVNEFELIPR